MAEPTPQAAFGGCLARVFNLFGFFLLVTGALAAVRSFNDGGRGIGVIGALIPGLALILMARAIKRRMGRGAWAGDNSDRQLPNSQPGRPQASARVEPTPQPTAPQRSADRLRASKTPPNPGEIPELVVEEMPDESTTAIEDLDLDDFKPEKPLSSEERIRQARQRYNKKPE